MAAASAATRPSGEKCWIRAPAPARRNSRTAPCRSNSSDIPDALDRHGERRHPVKALTLYSQRLAARRQHSRGRVGTQQCRGLLAAAPITCSQLSSSSSTSCLAASALATRSADAAPPLRSSLSAVATVTGTRSGSDRDASSATQTPSANSVIRCRPTSRPRRVLPTPPSPIKVTSRWVVTRSITSESSASRPISSDTGSGRFVGWRDGLGSGRCGLSVPSSPLPGERARISPVNW